MVVPVASAVVGVAGGVILGRNAWQGRSKTLGVPVAKKSIDFSGLGKNIGEAGRQFAKLAQEVHAVREKAEQVGRAIS
jgi:hypothetical protein